MAYLTIRVKGEDGFTQHDLDGERVVVGRTEDCDVTIAHDSISRQHCAFVREGGTWYVEDLGSSNGTRVDGEKIQGRVALGERTIVKPGKARLTFHAGERKRRDEGPIAVDAGDGGTAPTRERGIDDPPEATRCDHCGAWLSIAHRLPGESMTCAACGRPLSVPQLVG